MYSSGSLRRSVSVACVAFLAGGACRGSIEPNVRSTWTKLDAGLGGYTCGLADSGLAFCWGGVGGYYYPPLPPDSAIPNSAVPTLVRGGQRFSDVTVGALMMCALDSEGRAYCWGDNWFGELGDGTTITKRGPSAVIGGIRWRQISAGGTHVCGISLDGVTYCWGNNFRGALGLGNGLISGASGEPLRVNSNVTFSAVWAGGGTSCALTPDGKAYCWGINDYGMLGDGQPPEPFRENPTPASVVGGLTFRTLAIGGYNVCGITLAARAFCWGYGGVLGNATTQPSSSPVPVSGDLHWKSLSVGAGHTCGLTTDGATYCWGNGERGRFGDGYTGIALTPRLIALAGTYVSMIAGEYHTCGLNAAGVAFCWGHGDYGQLGHGLFRDELRPVQVVAPQ